MQFKDIAGRERRAHINKVAGRITFKEALRDALVFFAAVVVSIAFAYAVLIIS